MITAPPQPASRSEATRAASTGSFTRATDHRGVRPGVRRGVGVAPRHRFRHVHWSVYALHRQRRQFAELHPARGARLRGVVDDNPACGGLHEARGAVHRRPHDAVVATRGAPVRAAEHDARRHTRIGGYSERSQPMANSKRGLYGPSRVVVVGLPWKAKGQHERASLVIPQHLVERAVEPVRFFLRDDRRRVQSRKIRRGPRINRGEPHEHCARIAKLREEIGMTAQKAVAHQRQHQLLYRFEGVVLRRDHRGYAVRVLSRQSLDERYAVAAPRFAMRGAGDRAPCRCGGEHVAGARERIGREHLLERGPADQREPSPVHATDTLRDERARADRGAQSQSRLIGRLALGERDLHIERGAHRQARGRAQVRALVLEERHQRIAGEQSTSLLCPAIASGEDAVGVCFSTRRVFPAVPVPRARECASDVSPAKSVNSAAPCRVLCLAALLYRPPRRVVSGRGTDA